MEIPESMKKLGCKIMSEEEYKEYCKIDKDFYTTDEDEICAERETQNPEE